MPKKTSGLTSKEAKKKLDKYGPNEIKRQQKVTWLPILVNQFRSPLIYILFFAGILSLVLGELIDAGVIFLAVLVNTGLGFFQEYKSEKAIESLRKIVKPKAVVVRGGQKEEIKAVNIVPEDIVIVKRGQTVPADGKVIKSKDFYVNEAILTGESRPVAKKEEEKVFMGSTVVSGTVEFRVTKTGKKTRMGQIASKLKGTVSESTPLKLQVQNLAKTLTLIIGVLCLIVTAEGLFLGRSFEEIFTVSVSLAVASIPEGLAISVTMVLALGMKRISKKKGLVRKLLAAETLGAVNVICLDKTGTLTEGKMRVVEVEAKKEAVVQKALIIANSLVNAVDIALWDWVKDKASSFTGGEELLERVEEQLPFSAQRKFSAGKMDGIIYIYGAPEILLKNSQLKKEEVNDWENKLQEKTAEGYRAIAVGIIKEDVWENLVENDWQGVDVDFQGLIFFADPVRKGVKESLNLAKKAGIKLKVITGDYYHTAAAVINQLDLNHGPLKPSELMNGKSLEKITASALAGKVEEIKLFYRVSPEQKIKIVTALQKNGKTVAMMGDGVNDALALKKADIGIVVGEATDVAKQTADMVLMDSNFSTIVTAVEQGRIIFENIRKVIVYLLSGSFTELMLIGFSFAVKLPLPVLPAQILWVNLFQDSLPALALAYEEGVGDVMKQKPRDKGSRLLDREVKRIIFIVSVISDILLIGLFLYFLNLGYSIKIVRTIIFLSLAFDSLLFVFATRSLSKNIWEFNPFSNNILNFSVLIGFFFMLLVAYLPFLGKIFNTVPLPPRLLVVVIIFGLLDLILIELIKLWSKNKVKK